MNTAPNQESSDRPTSITLAFYTALLALGIFAFLTVLQILQTYGPDAPALIRQDFLKANPGAASLLSVEKIRQFIPEYRIGLMIWLVVLGCLYLAVAFSFRKGRKFARTAAAVLALLSVTGLFSPGYLSSLWVLFNSVTAALLFTRSSAVFFDRRSKAATALNP